MRTLDQLSRSDLLQVLGYIKKYMMFENNAKINRNTIQNRIRNNNKTLSDKKKFRNAILGFVIFLAIYPTMFSIFAISVMFGNNEKSSKLSSVFLYLLIIAVVASIVFLIYKVLKKRQKSDIEKISELNAGLIPYISEYTAIMQQSQREYQKYFTYYNIHSSLQNLAAIEFVISELSSNARVSLYSSVNNFYQQQHNEMMRQEAINQRLAVEKIQKDNQSFHEDVKNSLHDIKNELNRQTEIQSDVAWSILH